ncbi:MAG: glycosyltransferase [Xenococcus sp. MO_188.B8]|nr:glycosyltransferase [Xenococcus sp. MO_188.B8]
MTIKPVIIVVAYNRPNSLQRLLNSLAQADYTGYDYITLIISIDHSNSSEVISVAKNFTWKFGHKEIIKHSENLGLKKHIIFCGDFTEQYQSVIILEDDLVVAPAFYNYCCQALNYYQDHANISGISLYSYFYNEYAQIRFMPLDDGFDNYFLQSATSWGQAWTKKQWQEFKNWYKINQRITINKQDQIPNKVASWSDRSWKKYFIKYMIETKKYFVIPRISLTTNCSEPGAHIISKHDNYHAYLLLRSKNFNFSEFNSSQAIYDAYYELEPRSLYQYLPWLAEYALEFDFYGTKNLTKIKSEYLMTIRDSSNPIKSYPLELIPSELNVVFDLTGEFFNFTKVTDCRAIAPRKKLAQYVNLHQYAGIKRYAALAWHSLREKLNIF